MNQIHTAKKWSVLSRTFGPDAIKQYWEKQFGASVREIEFEWMASQPRFANHLVSGSVAAAQNFIRRFPLVMIYPGGPKLEQFIRSYRELGGGTFTGIDPMRYEHSAGPERFSREMMQRTMAATAAPDNESRESFSPADVTADSVGMGEPSAAPVRAVTGGDFTNPDPWDENRFFHSAGYFTNGYFTHGYFTRKIREQMQQWARFGIFTGITGPPLATLLTFEEPAFSLPDLEYLRQIIPGSEDSALQRVQDTLELDGNPTELVTTQSESKIANEVVRKPEFTGLGRYIHITGLDFTKGRFHFQKPLQTIPALMNPPVQTMRENIDFEAPGTDEPFFIQGAS